ncbi:hypothetical protein Droror1_Dr00024047, partial [Drosera rotundifolia]
MAAARFHLATAPSTLPSSTTPNRLLVDFLALPTPGADLNPRPKNPLKLGASKPSRPIYGTGLKAQGPK